MKHIDPYTLRTGDILGVTTGISEISVPIRGCETGAREWERTHDAIDAMEDGIEAALDPGVASHIQIVLIDHDLIGVIEMGPHGCRPGDILDDDKSTLGSHYCFAARILQETDEAETAAKQWLLKAPRRYPHYGFGSLFQWIGLGKINPARPTCSELPRNMGRELWRLLKAPYPKEWETRVCPLDWQVWTALNNLQFRWWKFDAPTGAEEGNSQCL